MNPFFYSPFRYTLNLCQCHITVAVIIAVPAVFADWYLICHDFFVDAAWMIFGKEPEAIEDILYI